MLLYPGIGSLKISKEQLLTNETPGMIAVSNVTCVACIAVRMSLTNSFTSGRTIKPFTISGTVQIPCKDIAPLPTILQRTSACAPKILLTYTSNDS